MAIAGSFAGLGGALDILGWQFRLGSLDIQTSQIGFIGIAVALLGRNTAIGVGLVRAPVRRAALRDVDAEPRPRGLPAGARRELDADDPGARPALRRRRPARRLRLEPAAEAPPTRRRARGGSRMTAGSATGRRELLDRLPRGNRAVAWVGVLLGLLAFFVALPPIAAESPVWPVLFGLLGIAAGLWAVTRGVGRLAWGAIVLGIVGIGLGYLATLSGDANLDLVVDLVRALRGDAALRDAAHVRGDRRHVQRARRRREHRPRGDDAHGRVLRDPRCRQARLVAARAPRRARSRED